MAEQGGAQKENCDAAALGDLPFPLGDFRNYSKRRCHGVLPDLMLPDFHDLPAHGLEFLPV